MKTSRQLKLVIEVKMKDFGNEPHIRKPETFSSGSWSYDRRDFEIIKYHSHSEASITQVYVIMFRALRKQGKYISKRRIIRYWWSMKLPRSLSMRDAVTSTFS